MINKTLSEYSKLKQKKRNVVISKPTSFFCIKKINLNSKLDSSFICTIFSFTQTLMLLTPVFLNKRILNLYLFKLKPDIFLLAFKEYKNQNFYN